MQAVATSSSRGDNFEGTSRLSPCLSHVSHVSEKKRIVIDQDFGQWFEESRVDFELQEACLDWRVVHEMRFLMRGHKDPADRFLAATAKAHDLTLVTADQRLLRVPGLKTLANI